MRILLIGLNYSPEVVGIGPYNTQLAEHLATSGHEVTVLTSFPYYPHWAIDSEYSRKRPFLVESINSVRVIRSMTVLPGNRASTFRRILFDSLQAVTALLASVAIGRLDLVVCVSPPLQLGVTAWFVARSRGARLILQLQDIVPDAALSLGMMREGKALRLARWLERFVYARANVIPVISQGFVDNLVAKGVQGRKILVLPNWVDTDLFIAARDPRVRSALGAPNGETLVVHAGNMGAKQSLETVVNAAAELADEKVVIALIGDGNNRAALEERVGRLGLKNLRFFPIQADLPATLAAADVLVLAQRGKVVDSVAPSKLLSYMAAGKPIVASVHQLSEAGRMIRGAQCGVVVPPEDPAALAAALLELHRRPDNGQHFGEAARRHVADYHQRATVLGRWSQLAASQAASRRSG
jgi:colanic acid biosynthesis glycosyl transferase WcaI